jgi:hypothetical protein
MITSSNNVIWQGANIPCLNLCNGDSITNVIYQLATAYCQLVDMESYDTDCVTEATSLEKPENISELIQLLIDAICYLSTHTTGEQGPAGADGADGSVIEISANGTWMIDGVDTGISVQGAPGNNGIDGNDGADCVPPVITMYGDQIVIDGVVQSTHLTGPAGADGATGPQGDAGPQGIQGIQGETGKDGECTCLCENFYCTISAIEALPTYDACWIVVPHNGVPPYTYIWQTAQNGNSNISMTYPLSVGGITNGVGVRQILPKCGIGLLRAEIQDGNNCRAYAWTLYVNLNDCLA